MTLYFREYNSFLPYIDSYMFIPFTLIMILAHFFSFFMLRLWISKYNEEIRKKYALFLLKKQRFLLLGAHSRKQLYLIFYTFLFTKKLVPSFLLNIYIFYARFSIFSPFFAIDSTRQNREFVLTKGHISTAHVHRWSSHNGIVGFLHTHSTHSGT